MTDWKRLALEARERIRSGKEQPGDGVLSWAWCDCDDEDRMCEQPPEPEPCGCDESKALRARLARLEGGA